MKLYPFYAVAAHLKEFYDITVNNDSFENIALHGWDLIGNKRTKLYRFSGEIKDGRIELPCNIGYIEAVTSNNVDYTKTDNIQTDNFGNSILEEYIEGYKTNSPGLYTSGKLVNYHVDDTYLYVDGHSKINMLYKGILLDEEGLPSLNFKEVEALAVYVAYVTMNKKGMVTKDKGTIELAQMLKRDWISAKGRAQSPEYLDQNDMDAILDAKSSWDRKRFGVSYKPIR